MRRAGPHAVLRLAPCHVHGRMPDAVGLKGLSGASRPAARRGARQPLPHPLCHTRPLSDAMHHMGRGLRGSAGPSPLVVVLLAGSAVPCARGTSYGPPGVAAEFAFYLRCTLILTALLTVLLLVVAAVALLWFARLVVRAGPRQLGTLAWRMAAMNSKVAPGAA